MLYDKRAVPITAKAVPKTTIEIKHRNTGDVIFSRHGESDTFAKTLRIALILGIDVRYADMSNQDLSHGYFEDGNFAHCDFTGANLTGANFKHARFDHASMGGVIADGANFERAIMHNVFASGASFKGANLKHAMAMEGHYGSQSVNGVKISDGADFSGAEMVSFVSRGTNFKGITIEDCLLTRSSGRIDYPADPHKQGLSYEIIDKDTARWVRKYPQDATVPRFQAVPCVCDGPCQQCEGCLSPKKTGVTA